MTSTMTPSGTPAPRARDTTRLLARLQASHLTARPLLLQEFITQTLAMPAELRADGPTVGDARLAEIYEAMTAFDPSPARADTLRGDGLGGDGLGGDDLPPGPWWGDAATRARFMAYVGLGREVAATTSPIGAWPSYPAARAALLFEQDGLRSANRHRGPSGQEYRLRPDGGGVELRGDLNDAVPKWAPLTQAYRIPLEDVPLVARLLEAATDSVPVSQGYEHASVSQSTP